MQPTDTSNPDYFHRVVDCQWACPAHTDVPEYIRLIANGQFSDACNKAITFGKPRLMRDDWLKVFDMDEITESIRRIT